MRSSGRFAVLLALFFCSGACGLLYQVLWLRLLALVFGVTVYAASTVLAAFMAGLALGGAVAGRLVARVPRPLVIFGLAEILIGVSALATPLELDLASAVYRALHRAFPESLVALTAARLICSFAVLLLPTFLMGLTLPVLSGSGWVRGQDSGSRISALYAVNTAGAVVGAAMTGFYLIGAAGIHRSFLIGAALNIAVGSVALILGRREDVQSTDTAAAIGPERDPPLSRLPNVSPGVIAIVVAASGLASLALEIVWFRTLAQYLATTTYAFTTMLATVLAGIAIGSGIAARLLRRPRDLTLWLAWTQVATAVAVTASATFLGWSYGAGWRTGGDIQASVAAILPAAILMGIGFPIALRLVAAGASSSNETTRRVGQLYALNVCGAIVGALVGGFILLPWLGVRVSLIAMAALYGASSLLLLAQHPARRRLLVPVAIAAALFVWSATRVPDPFEAAYTRRYGRDMREYWREEGVQTAVSVHASQFRRSLYLDGLHQANDSPDMVQLHRTIGHLPMVLHPSPARALVIGLGGGATAGAVTQHAGVDVTIVELSESVRRAASFFAHVNYDVLTQPNVRVRVDDGRNYLLLSGERFDVITADIIQPIHAGAGNLYSREYFQLVRAALAEGGVALQWIGHRPETQYKLIMRTFVDVFPHATLWLDGNLMAATIEPMRLRESVINAKFANPRTREALASVGLDTFATLRSWYTAGAREMRRFVGDGPVLTDDRPLVEYHRSLGRDAAPLDLSTLKGDVNEIIVP